MSRMGHGAENVEHHVGGFALQAALHDNGKTLYSVHIDFPDFQVVRVVRRGWPGMTVSEQATTDPAWEIRCSDEETRHLNLAGSF